MKVDNLDHLVLTVADIGRTIAFYADVLGMEPVEAEGRHALRFGAQKINLHQVDHTFEPKARHPLPGSADLCFLTAVPVADVLAHLAHRGVTVVEGPVERTGAAGRLRSVYVRDPDANLVEISTLAG